ncbi:MAG TPA: hypothetical protein VGE55_08505 [Limnobacter sp.]|uniref:hypothetical protein n=1 Tax=Limnobacter sp. TaxID=2003368 RepID=UPI002EDA9D32
MMQKTRSVLLAGVALTLLTTACGRLEDANGGKGYAGKADTPAFSSGGGTYSTGEYKAGDKEGWKESLAVRAKGQNEYLRTPPRDGAAATK